MWKAVPRLGPAASTQKRTRSPTLASNGSPSMPYWSAIPLNTTALGASAAIASALTSVASSGEPAAEER